MKVFISVISHGHEAIIRDLDCLSKLATAPDFVVMLKNNCSASDKTMAKYCTEKLVHFVDEQHGLGFGENNNYLFDYALRNLGMDDDDYFLVLNPDLVVEPDSLRETIRFAKSEGREISTINLYKDSAFSVFDCCVRRFPSAIDFLSSYAGFGNKTIIDKSNVRQPIETDWAAGSFLLFKVSLYRQLGGFDPSYFMYCEDIDICWRAHKLFDKKLIFNPGLKAIHHAQHANRSIFSKHFLWHVKSIFRYLLMYYGLRKPYKNEPKEVV